MPDKNRFMPLSKNAFDLLRELVVYYPKDKAVRFAGLSSGGYVLFQKALAGVERIYSYGVDKYNLPFDLAITQKLQISCHCYSCSIHGFPENKFINFHKKEMGACLGGFSKHVVDNGDKGKNIVLKIDLEGGEWKFLGKFTDKDFSSISQIVVEYHNMLSEDKWPQYTNIFKKINQYYYLCYIQAINTEFDAISFDDKLYLHNKYGATYIRKDLGKCLINTMVSFPTKVEYPNVTSRPYVSLNSWPYRSDRESMRSLIAIIKMRRLRSFFDGISPGVLPMKKWVITRDGSKFKVRSRDLSADRKGWHQEIDDNNPYAAGRGS